MIAVDTSVLVRAHRRSLPGHERAVAMIEGLARGRVPWGLPVFCIGEFVRVVTHPRVFDPPSTLDDASGAIGALLRSPTVRLLSPGPRFAGLFEEALHEGNARGNLAFDAQIVAVCREQGAGTLLTLDHDFARFPGFDTIGLDEQNS